MQGKFKWSPEWSVDVAVPATRLWLPDTSLSEVDIPMIANARRRVGHMLALSLLLALLALSPVLGHAAARTATPHGGTLAMKCLCE